MKSELNRLKAEESSLFNSILSNDYENSVLTSFKGEFTKYEDKSGGKLRPDWMNNSDDEEEDHYFVKYLNRGDTSAIRRRPLQLPGFHDYQHHSISPLQIYSKDIRTRQLECSMLGIKLSKEHHDWVVDCLSRNPLQRSKHAVEQVYSMIHHSKFFAVIPKKIALVVCRFLCLERYNKGEVVYEEGQYGNKMFILSCGAVNLDQNQSTTIESKKRGQGTRRVGDGGRDRRGTRGSRKNKSNSKQRRQGNGKQGKYSINYSSDGTYSRHNDGDEKIKDSHQDGEDTNTLIDQYYSGDCFGEDALLSADSVRESTATASMERTELFVISRKIYDLLQGYSDKVYTVRRKFLQTRVTGKVFSDLQEDVALALAYDCRKIVKKRGEVLLVQGRKHGEEQDCVYIIQRGACRVIKNVKRAVEEEEEDFQALLTNNKNGLTCKSSSKFGGKRRKLTQRGKGTCSSNTTPNSSNDSNNSVTGNEIDVRIRGSLFSLHDNKTSNIGQSDGKNSGANNFKSDNCEVRAAFVDGDLRVGDSVHVFENNVRSDELELVEIASLGLGDIFGRIMSSDDFRNPFSVIAESEVALLRLPTSSLKERVTPSTIKKLAYLLDIYDCTGEEASDKAHESRFWKKYKNTAAKSMVAHMASKRYHQRVRLGDAFRAAQFPHGVPEPKVPDKVMEDYDNRMLIRWAIMRGLNAQKVNGDVDGFRRRLEKKDPDNTFKGGLATIEDSRASFEKLENEIEELARDSINTNRLNLFERHIQNKRIVTRRRSSAIAAHLSTALSHVAPSRDQERGRQRLAASSHVQFPSTGPKTLPSVSENGPAPASAAATVVDALLGAPSALLKRTTSSSVYSFVSSSTPGHSMPRPLSISSSSPSLSSSSAVTTSSTTSSLNTNFVHHSSLASLHSESASKFRRTISELFPQEATQSHELKLLLQSQDNSGHARQHQRHIEKFRNVMSDSQIDKLTNNSKLRKSSFYSPPHRARRMGTPSLSTSSSAKPSPHPRTVSSLRSMRRSGSVIAGGHGQACALSLFQKKAFNDGTRSDSRRGGRKRSDTGILVPGFGRSKTLLDVDSVRDEALQGLYYAAESDAVLTKTKFKDVGKELLFTASSMLHPIIAKHSVSDSDEDIADDDDSGKMGGKKTKEKERTEKERTEKENRLFTTANDDPHDYDYETLLKHEISFASSSLAPTQGSHYNNKRKKELSSPPSLSSLALVPASRTSSTSSFVKSERMQGLKRCKADSKKYGHRCDHTDSVAIGECDETDRYTSLKEFMYERNLSSNTILERRNRLKNKTLQLSLQLLSDSSRKNKRKSDGPSRGSSSLSSSSSKKGKGTNGKDGSDEETEEEMTDAAKRKLYKKRGISLSRKSNMRKASALFNTMISSFPGEEDGKEGEEGEEGGDKKTQKNGMSSKLIFLSQSTARNKRERGVGVAGSLRKVKEGNEGDDGGKSDRSGDSSVRKPNINDVIKEYEIENTNSRDRGLMVIIENSKKKKEDKTMSGVNKKKSKKKMYGSRNREKQPKPLAFVRRGAPVYENDDHIRKARTKMTNSSDQDTRNARAGVTGTRGGVNRRGEHKYGNFVSTGGRNRRTQGRGDSAAIQKILADRKEREQGRGVRMLKHGLTENRAGDTGKVRGRDNSNNKARGKNKSSLKGRTQGDRGNDKNGKAIFVQLPGSQPDSAAASLSSLATLSQSKTRAEARPKPTRIIVQQGLQKEIETFEDRIEVKNDHLRTLTWILRHDSPAVHGQNMHLTQKGVDDGHNDESGKAGGSSKADRSYTSSSSAERKEGKRSGRSKATQVKCKNISTVMHRGDKNGRGAVRGLSSSASMLDLSFLIHDNDSCNHHQRLRKKTRTTTINLRQFLSGKPKRVAYDRSIYRLPTGQSMCSKLSQQKAVKLCSFGRKNDKMAQSVKEGVMERQSVYSKFGQAARKKHARVRVHGHKGKRTDTKSLEKLSALVDSF